jgi:hypothetical protein
MIRRTAAILGSDLMARVSSTPFMPGIFMSTIARSYGAPHSTAARNAASA